ncbi:DUF3391 domain-containing protein (plasmid) [Paraburkholderia sp. PREW-6R]|uniref:DUF3391 domain-containing protein n=1 Tax=Paraburkholderia sp. PREW-6R TaxID=3141544 RepID=UPI0031F4C596
MERLKNEYTENVCVHFLPLDRPVFIKSRADNRKRAVVISLAGTGKLSDGDSGTHGTVAVTGRARFRLSLIEGKTFTVLKISADQLRVGMYIQKLGGSWLSHPFFRSRFLLDKRGDLQAIIDAGIDEVWIDPEKGLKPARRVAEDEKPSILFQRHLSRSGFNPPPDSPPPEKIVETAAAAHDQRVSVRDERETRADHLYAREKQDWHYFHGRASGRNHGHEVDAAARRRDCVVRAASDGGAHEHCRTAK